MSLIFVERHPHYSTYRRPDGTIAFLSHTTPPRFLIEFDRAELSSLWTDCDLELDEFREHLAGIITDPDIVDNIIQCDDCDEVLMRDETFETANDGRVCESCCDENYRQCSRCNVYDDEYRGTVYDDVVCEECCNDYYSYCDNCEGYRRDNDYDHSHVEGDGCCDSPALEFAIRNDGEPPLLNDVRVTITLPAGTIDAEGIQRIRRYLYDEQQYTADSLVLTLDPQWQTRQGNFTKRLSSALYKHNGTKMPQHVLSQIGCIAREHSASIDFSIETTRDLNMSAQDFYHEDSCWWGSYSRSRCALKSNGGFGLRSFDGTEAWNDVSGRAWVMPLKQDSDGALSPTFNAELPAAYVVFNGYGDLEGYAAARIVSHMSGWTYRKINFSCSPMFVNGESGYIVAPEDIAQKVHNSGLHFYVDQHASLYNSEIAAPAVADKEFANA